MAQQPIEQAVGPTLGTPETFVIDVNGIRYNVPTNLQTGDEIKQFILAQHNANPAQNTPGASLGMQGPAGKTPAPGFKLPEGNQAMGRDFKSMLATALNTGAIGATMIPGAGTPLSMLLGAGSGYLEGGMTDPTPGGRGAVTGALENGALGGIAHLGSYIPKLFNRGAYMLGGLGNVDAKEAATALEGVNKGKGLSAGSVSRRLPVGAEARAEAIRKDIGQTVDLTRQNDPNFHSLREAYGQAGAELKPKQVDTFNPEQNWNKLRDALENSYKQHYRVRELAPLEGQSVDFSASRPPGQQTPGLVKAESGLAPSQGLPRAEADSHLLSGETTQGPIKAGPEVNQNPAKGPNYKNERKISTEEIRQLETKLKHSNAAENLGKARSTGDAVNEADYFQGNIDTAVAKKIQDAAYAAETQNGKPGPMQLADKQYADIKNVINANQRTRAPGLFAEPGKLGARGGLGSAVARSAVGATVGGLGGGAQGGSSGATTGAVAGSLLGPLLLSPSGLSRSGYLLDNLLKATDIGGLTKKALDTASGEPEKERAAAAKRKTKLRSPK